MAKTMGFEVVGLGCSALDYLGIVSCYPPLDVKLELLEFSKQGGGPVATALVTLSRLGVSTSYIGRVGNDEQGRFILEEFEKEGVDTRGVIIEQGGSSLFAFCIIEKSSGKRTIFWKRGNYSQLDLERLDKQLVLSARFLHLDGHHIKAAIQVAIWAKEKKIKIVLDPDINPPEMKQLVGLTDIIIASSDFARAFTREKDCSKAAERLFSLGPEVVVITLGQKGCLCVSREGVFTRAAFRVKVIDTTGAGDVFHGAFIYGLLKGWNLEKTAQFSSAVSAIKCMKLGGRAGIPTLEKAKEFLASRSNLFV